MRSFPHGSGLPMAPDAGVEEALRFDSGEVGQREPGVNGAC